MADDSRLGQGGRRPILIAVDGEPHTDSAIAEAVRLARALSRPAAILHVEDPYLKQFSNEIYAQGREEYLEHVDRCLGEAGREAVEAASERFEQEGIEISVLIRKGEPLEVIRAELERISYPLLIVGRKTRRGSRRRHRRDLPARLAEVGGSAPLLIVPEDHSDS